MRDWRPVRFGRCPPGIFSRNAFAPLSRGQANIKALAFNRRDEPEVAGAGAFIFVPSITFAKLGLAEPFLRALDRERFLSRHPSRQVPFHRCWRAAICSASPRPAPGRPPLALPMLQHLGRLARRRIATARAPHRRADTRTRSPDRGEPASPRRRSEIAHRRDPGRPQPFEQVQRMRAWADIVVGTPGRICDLMATGE